MTPEQKALREAVARAMAAKDSGPEGSTLFEIHWREFGDGYLSGAEAAISVALERAAKLMDDMGAREQKDHGLTRGAQNYFRGRDAIRALIKEK